MRNFQDTFETCKRSFISAFFNLHDCNFKSFKKIYQIQPFFEMKLKQMRQVYTWAMGGQTRALPSTGNNRLKALKRQTFLLSIGTNYSKSDIRTLEQGP